jgi:hypothetical protein
VKLRGLQLIFSTTNVTSSSCFELISQSVHDKLNPCWGLVTYHCLIHWFDKAIIACGHKQELPGKRLGLNYCVMSNTPTFSRNEIEGAKTKWVYNRT